MLTTSSVGTPPPPRSDAELDELLSRPSEADRQAMRDLDGDLLILGVAGKMGPTLARLARRAADDAGVKKRILGVARFSDPAVAAELSASGVEVIQADLLQQDALASLPSVRNVIFMAARKFGTAGQEGATWAINGYLPALVAQRFSSSRIVAFSTGNVYPLTPIATGGCSEQHPLGPVGEYAQSALARERMFEYFSSVHGTPVTLLRLNYAVDLRYGVLPDIARKVYEGRPVDLTTGAVNAIWQRDANSVCLRSLALADTPPRVLNLTGPETISVAWLARQFGELFQREPQLQGGEAPTALLSNASLCHARFGYPSLPLQTLVEYTAAWIAAGGRSLHRPTHFEQRQGRY
ncbi:MAG: NAD(P)-dependent oxidoreductase [Paludibaculum sp.]